MSMLQLLTVRPGEEDYLDTSFLLRQASPYTKIKYDGCYNNCFSIELFNYLEVIFEQGTVDAGLISLKNMEF